MPKQAGSVGGDTAQRNRLMMIAAAVVLVAAGGLFFLRREPNLDQQLEAQVARQRAEQPAQPSGGTGEQGSIDIGDEQKADHGEAVTETTHEEEQEAEAEQPAQKKKPRNTATFQ